MPGPCEENELVVRDAAGNPFVPDGDGNLRLPTCGLADVLINPLTGEPYPCDAETAGTDVTCTGSGTKGPPEHTSGVTRVLSQVFDVAENPPSATEWRPVVTGDPITVTNDTCRVLRIVAQANWGLIATADQPVWTRLVWEIDGVLVSTSPSSPTVRDNLSQVSGTWTRVESLQPGESIEIEPRIDWYSLDLTPSLYRAWIEDVVQWNTI